MQVNVNSDCLEPAPSTAVIAKTKVNGLSAGVFNALETAMAVKINAVWFAGYTTGRSKRFLTRMKTTPVCFIDLMETCNHQLAFREHYYSAQSMLIVA